MYVIIGTQQLLYISYVAWSSIDTAVNQYYFYNTAAAGYHTQGVCKTSRYAGSAVSGRTTWAVGGEAGRCRGLRVC